MRIGIVGHEAAKFTPAAEAQARWIVRSILEDALSADGVPTVVSGGCHLGGIDKWAEEIAAELWLPMVVHAPKVLTWEGGYKPRNILIAEDSDEVHNIVVRALPATYRGMRFSRCYHCHTTDHVKSGGCWTAKYAQRLGKPAFWHVIE